MTLVLKAIVGQESKEVPELKERKAPSEQVDSKGHKELKERKAELELVALADSDPKVVNQAQTERAEPVVIRPACPLVLPTAIAQAQILIKVAELL